MKQENPPLKFSWGIFLWGAVVEEVRTIFAQRNDATIYIPSLKSYSNP